MTGLDFDYPTSAFSIAAKPGGWGKAKAVTEVKASLCADCGYVEFYATRPLPVWDEWSNQNR